MNTTRLFKDGLIKLFDDFENISEDTAYDRLSILYELYKQDETQIESKFKESNKEKNGDKKYTISMIDSDNDLFYNRLYNFFNKYGNGIIDEEDNNDTVKRHFLNIYKIFSYNPKFKDIILNVIQEEFIDDDNILNTVYTGKILIRNKHTGNSFEEIFSTKPYASKFNAIVVAVLAYTDENFVGAYGDY